MKNERTGTSCPNCNGRMVIDNEKGCYRCLHCGTEIRFEESDRVTIERIKSNERIKAEQEKNEAYKTIQKMKGNVEIEKSKHKSVRVLLWVILIFGLIAAFAGWKAIHKIENAYDVSVHKDDISITQTMVNYQGTTFEDMERCFKDAGFTNIEGIPLSDLTPALAKKDGLITSISINGTKDYKTGDWAATDASVKVTYHSISENDLNGIQAFENAEYYVGKDYSIADADIMDAGFYNIELVPLKDLREGDKQIGDIAEIMINGNDAFEFTTLFPEDANVVIKYHSQKVKKCKVGTSSEDFKKKNYQTVVNDLKNAGFYNFDYSLLEDASLLKKKDTVEEVSINGRTEYTAESSFDEDARIAISIHIDKKDRAKIETELYPDSGRVIMPLSPKEMVGKNYAEIAQRLEDAGFTNVILYPHADIKDGFNPLKKKEGEIQAVTINGSNDFNKNYSYANDVLIRIIYHTHVDETETTVELGQNEVQLTFSAKDLKSENYKDVEKTIKKAGFTNITSKGLEDIDPNSKLKVFSAKDGEVKEVTINNNKKFSKGEVFDSDAEIIISYHSYKK